MIGPSGASVRHGRNLALLALTLPFLVPLWRDGWIQSHEGLSYPVRVFEVARCWRDGFLSARWFPDLNYGQGYPFLSFYAPLLFWIAGIFHTLGADVAASLKWVTSLGVVAGAFGADRLMREGLRGGGATEHPAAGSAGFVAAALFVFAPYCVRDLYIRGALAELFALGLLPWSFWGLFRLRRMHTPRAVATSAALGALPILAHNIMGLFTGIALCVAGGILVVTSKEKLRTLRFVAASGAATLLLSVFFWAPAFSEKSLVQTDNLTTGALGLDVMQHFVKPSQLLGRGELPGEGQGLPMSFEIGWVPLAAVALAIIFARAVWRASPSLALLGAFLFFGGTVRTMEISRPVYETFSILRYVQFPWRFLSFVALGAGLLGGLGFMRATASIPPRLRVALAVLVALVAIAFVEPILGPKPNFAIPPWALDPAEMVKRRDTTTNGDYLPITATNVERPRGFTDGVRIEGSGRTTEVRRKTGRYEIHLVAEAPIDVILQDLYFPGWVARLDEVPVHVAPEASSGRMRIAVPAGTSTLEVKLGPTPLRRITTIVSGLSALIALGIVLPLRPWKREERTAP